MASIELGGTLKALKGERAKVHSELVKLDKAITSFEGVVRNKYGDIEWAWT